MLVFGQTLRGITYHHHIGVYKFFLETDKGQFIAYYDDDGVNVTKTPHGVSLQTEPRISSIGIDRDIIDKITHTCKWVWTLPEDIPEGYMHDSWRQSNV